MVKKEIEIWSKMYTDNKWRLEKIVEEDSSNFKIRGDKVVYITQQKEEWVDEEEEEDEEYEEPDSP